MYQALPSAATASPSGSLLRLDVGSRSMRPLRRRPIASAWSMVNQMLPSAPAAIAIGASCGSLMWYSTNFSSGTARTSRSAPAARTAMPSTAASVLIPKFASIRGTLRTNFGIDKDTGNSMIPVPLLNPKFSTAAAARYERTSGSSGHARISAANGRRRAGATGATPQHRRRSVPAHKTRARRRG